MSLYFKLTKKVVYVYAQTEDFEKMLYTVRTPFFLVAACQTALQAKTGGLGPTRPAPPRCGSFSDLPVAEQLHSCCRFSATAQQGLTDRHACRGVPSYCCRIVSADVPGQRAHLEIPAGSEKAVAVSVTPDV